MKKTIFSVLAFVLVLSTVLTGIAVTSVSAEANLNMGECYQVNEDSPIIVDGKMDEAYTHGFSVMMTDRVQKVEGVYTYGIAYFVWSKTSIYCYVIVNDLQVNERIKTDSNGVPSFWQSDAVELYVHRGDDILRDYPTTENALLNGENMPVAPPTHAHKGSTRARQYRIDGYDGDASCYMFCAEDVTYWWDKEDGSWKNNSDPTSDNPLKQSASMIKGDFNAFGWYEGGWAHNVFDTKAEEADSPLASGKGTPGYAVEYKIDFDTPLQSGEKIRFDIMVSDRSGDDITGYQQINFYYKSGIRHDAPASVSNINSYDHFVLSDKEAVNSRTLENAELYDYGRADAHYPYSEKEVEKELSKTERYSFTRVRTGTTTKPTESNTQQGGNTPGGNTPGGNTTTTKAPEQSGGGCGGTIATTASVAVLASVGAAGFYVFRRKKH